MLRGSAAAGWADVDAMASGRWATMVDVDAVDSVMFQPVMAIGTACVLVRYGWAAARRRRSRRRLARPRSACDMACPSGASPPSSEEWSEKLEDAGSSAAGSGRAGRPMTRRMRAMSAGAEFFLGVLLKPAAPVPGIKALAAARAAMEVRSFQLDAGGAGAAVGGADGMDARGATPGGAAGSWLR